MIWTDQPGHCQGFSWILQQKEQQKTPQGFPETPGGWPAICWVNKHHILKPKNIYFENGLHQKLPSFSTLKNIILKVSFHYWPVWHDPWIDTFQVFINSYFIVFQEALLMFVSSYYRETWHCLTKVRVYRRARHWVQAAQLSWRCYVELLGVKRRQKIDNSWFWIDNYRKSFIKPKHFSLHLSQERLFLWQDTLLQ